MAKKGQAIQLQTEVNNDEEWEKLLQRDGLLVIDVYSDWCGPCSGMTATLKKLKLEIGGDVLLLAIAKSDKITALERFRNKSEPTWMFVVNGKMVNFMFGANAPKLTRLITEELRKEGDARLGRRERVQNDIAEITDEEKERLEVRELQDREAKEKERAKAAKELRERRTAECQNILETLQHLGVIIIFPHARNAYQEAFGDLFGEAALTISQTEKYEMSPEVLEELFYFGEMPFDDEAVEELLNNTCLLLLVKPLVARDLEEETDDIINRIVYGASRKAPGSTDCVARQLAKLPMHSDEEIPEKPRERVAIWVPENELIKATALRLFFRRITESYLIAEPEPTPPHYAVVFDSLKRSEVQPLMEKYADEVLRYGFFTSDVPEEAQIVAKTIRKYEKAPSRAPDQKMVIQLSKKKSECVLAFAQLKPAYISASANEGERECKLFFPDDYDEPPEEEVEEVVPPPKKGKKPPAEGEVQEVTAEEMEEQQEGLSDGAPSEIAAGLIGAEESIEAVPDEVSSQVLRTDTSQILPTDESQTAIPDASAQFTPTQTDSIVMQPEASMQAVPIEAASETMMPIEGSAQTVAPEASVEVVPAQAPSEIAASPEVSAAVEEIAPVEAPQEPEPAPPAEEPPAEVSPPAETKEEESPDANE